MPVISKDEFKALEAIAKRDDMPISRTQLEKLSRLDLIEPCPQGVCATVKGKKVLGE